MRKKSKGLHAIEPSKNINFPYICILIIFILFFTFVYFKFIHFNLVKNYELPSSDYNNSSLSSSQQFENSASFSSICTLDLSNVVKYSVTLIK